MKVESRLGKGLGAFFENNKREVPAFNPAINGAAQQNAGQNAAMDIGSAAKASSGKNNNAEGVLYIPIGNITPNPNQPRKNFGEGQIRELAASIEKNGVLQPILARRTANNLFEIVAGERRWRAANLANLQEIPVIIKEFTDQQAFEIGLVENLQRENLSPIEEASGYKKLAVDFGYTQDDIAKLVSKSRSYVGNMLRLLTLPGEIQKMVDGGDISYTIARTLIGSENPIKKAKEIIKRDLNARQAEKIQNQNQPDGKSDAIEAELSSLKEALENELSTDVSIKFKNNKGEIIIKFRSLFELDTIITKINKT
jgi:ParB family chromosome partitioning protein